MINVEDTVLTINEIKNLLVSMYVFFNTFLMMSNGINPVTCTYFMRKKQHLHLIFNQNSLQNTISNF